jgi:uncharacterized membrane protein
VSYLKTFGRFWWDFVVGDDWRVAIGVVTALGLSALLVQQALPAWWLLPIAVLAILAESLRRATRGPR